jgi:hypothetical protein
MVAMIGIAADIEPGAAADRIHAGIAKAQNRPRSLIWMTGTRPFRYQRSMA